MVLLIVGFNNLLSNKIWPCARGVRVEYIVRIVALVEIIWMWHERVCFSRSFSTLFTVMCWF